MTADNSTASPGASNTRTTFFQPLEEVTKPSVSTGEAAYYLNRRQQTLRGWACYEGTGPIRPLRINGRLAWPVSDLRRVLGVAV